MIGVVPVPTTETVVARGDGSARGVITKDVTNWARNQVIELMRSDTALEVANQIRLENPPTIAVIDKSRGKPLREAVRTVDITFGSAIKARALAIVEAELARAIKRGTTQRSGRLSNLSNWRWFYSRGPMPTVGGSGIPLGPGDYLALRPENVPYATVVNAYVERGARITLKRKVRGGKDAHGPPKLDKFGFLEYAARRAQRHPLFAPYYVSVRYTDARPVAGEVSKRKRSAYLIITPRLGRRRR